MCSRKVRHCSNPLAHVKNHLHFIADLTVLRGPKTFVFFTTVTSHGRAQGDIVFPKHQYVGQCK